MHWKTQATHGAHVCQATLLHMSVVVCDHINQYVAVYVYTSTTYASASCAQICAPKSVALRVHVACLLFMASASMAKTVPALTMYAIDREGSATTDISLHMHNAVSGCFALGA